MNFSFTTSVRAYFFIHVLALLFFNNQQLSAHSVYRNNPAVCPTITDSIIILRHVTCVAGNNGELHVVGKGGVAPYTYTLSTISGDVTNSTGIFTGLVAKDYKLISEPILPQ